MARSTWLGQLRHIPSNGDRDAEENPTAQHLRDERRYSQYGSDTVVKSRARHASTYCESKEQLT
jgi:hypothetical protein